MVFEVAKVVKRAIKEYYRTNTIAGCLAKMDSPNFIFRTIVDDKSCQSPPNNYTFGGVFQTCDDYVYPDKWLCQDLVQKNLLTSNYSCSDCYEAVLVYQDSTAHSCYEPQCGYCYRDRSGSQVVCVFAYYSTYWCVARGEIPLNTGYLFGGLYSDSLNNPVKQARSCPLKFYPLRFGATTHVCSSDDYKHGCQSSVPFGGSSVAVKAILLEQVIY